MPGGDRGEGGKGKIGEDFVAEVGSIESIKPNNQSTLKKEDFATGNDEEYNDKPVEPGQILRGSFGATRTAIPASLRKGDIISSTHKTGIKRALSAGGGLAKLREK